LAEVGYVEGRKDAKIQQDESYPSTGCLPALNTSLIPASRRIRAVSGLTDTYRAPGFALCRVLATKSDSSIDISYNKYKKLTFHENI
jgi:hypothetical protein